MLALSHGECGFAHMAHTSHCRWQINTAQAWSSAGLPSKHRACAACLTLDQELWSHRQLISIRPPVDGQSAAREHIIGYCMGKIESMPLVLVGVSRKGHFLLLRIHSAVQELPVSVKHRFWHPLFRICYKRSTLRRTLKLSYQCTQSFEAWA